MATEFQVATRRVESKNPATCVVLREFECASEYDAREAISRARPAQTAWHSLGTKLRIEKLRNFQRLLYDNYSPVARLITQEAGKPYAEALTSEISVVLDSARFYIENSYALLRDEVVRHGNAAMKTKAGRISREPYGVVGIIAPWNYPFAIPATQSLAALAAGNAVVLKPSEFTSMTALKLAELLHRAGVPEAVFQVLVGDGVTGEALVNSAIDKVVFTGSVLTGKRIAQAAAQKLLPVVLELGGKDPMLVLEDADVDVSSSGAVWGAYMNAGQTCLSVERCYVHNNVYDHFVEACIRKTQQLRAGNGMDPETDVGPMIHEQQLRTVEMQIADAVGRGATVRTGGKRLSEIGANFYAPTILTGVTHEMRIMREETFGPVLPVMRFEAEEEAIRLANDSEYGLAASIWTRNRKRGEALARRINAGSVMVNDAVSCFGISEAPHGGTKASGVGRMHGRFGIEEMVRPKFISSDFLPGMKKLWWFGYGTSFTRNIQAVLDLQFASNTARRLGGAIRSVGCLLDKRI